MFNTLDIDSDDQYYVEEPLVMQKITRRAQTRLASRQRNIFKRKRKFAQCMITTLVISFVLGIVTVLVYAVKTSEFNNNARSKENILDSSQESGVNNRNAYWNTNFVVDSAEAKTETKHILVLTNSLKKWQLPKEERPPDLVEYNLECWQYDCNIEVQTKRKYYDAIVIDAIDLHEEVMSTSFADSLLVYAVDTFPTSNQTFDILNFMDFDLTMGYRSDADINWSNLEIRWPNGSHFAPAKNPRWEELISSGQPKPTIDKTKLLKQIENRTHFGIIYTCDNKTIGAQVFDELKSYLTELEIDIDTNCEDIDVHVDISSVEYKFMLAFEDQLCVDSISKYFYMALSRRIVPVVIGGPTRYENFAPPKSFIRAEDFLSVRELAEYLIDVSENQHKYLEYISLANDLNIEKARSPLCKLCRILHEQPMLELKKKYNVEKKWWNQNQCNKTMLLSS